MNMNISNLNNAIRRRLRRSLHVKAKKKSDACRWGIIGLGNMAQVFADALNGNSGSILSAVASRSIDKASAFARRNGVAKAYGSYVDMLSDTSLNLDVVYIATPVKYHYEHIKLCLEAGKSVLCEKPATSSADEFSELMSIAEKKGCFLMEGMWMKCLPVFQQAKIWLSEGRIGALKLIRADLYKREHIRPNLAIYNSNSGGGVIRDYGVYALAFVEGFMGMPDSVKGSSIMSSFEIDSDWQIYMERGSIQAFVNVSSEFKSTSKALLMGQEGSIEFESPFNRTNVVSLFGEDGLLKETKQYNYQFVGFDPALIISFT